MTSNLIQTEYLELWKEYGIEEIPFAAPVRAKTILPTPPEMPLEKTEGPVSINSLSLESIQASIGNCKRCGLCRERTTIVFGAGNAKAKLMFIGEGPGEEEDRQGLPFVGPAGQLLTKIIEAMGLKRDDVYIANIVKCRPPQNRNPFPNEIENCTPFLKAQIDFVKPKLIVALGLTAAKFLTTKDTTMSNLRGKMQTLAWDSNIALLPTYHPSYLLRNPSAKKIVWEDMKIAKSKLTQLS